MYTYLIQQSEKGIFNGIFKGNFTEGIFKARVIQKLQAFLDYILKLVK